MNLPTKQTRKMTLTFEYTTFFIPTPPVGVPIFELRSNWYQIWNYIFLSPERENRTHLLNSKRRSIAQSIKTSFVTVFDLKNFITCSNWPWFGPQNWNFILEIGKYNFTRKIKYDIKIGVPLKISSDILVHLDLSLKIQIYSWDRHDWFYW